MGTSVEFCKLARTVFFLGNLECNFYAAIYRDYTLILAIVDLFTFMISSFTPYLSIYINTNKYLQYAVGHVIFGISGPDYPCKGLK